MKNIKLIAGFILLTSSMMVSADNESVSDLIKEGYEIKTYTIQNALTAVITLQKKKSAYICAVRSEDYRTFKCTKL